MKEQKYFSPFPDEFNFSLIHHAYALCSQINSTGTLLASGHTTGLVIIWDFVFRKTVHTINHHVYPIADVAWSKSKKLAICSYDRTISIWDSQNCSMIVSMTLSDVPVKCMFNNDQENLILLSMLSQPSRIIDTLANTQTLLPSLEADTANNSSICTYDRTGHYIIQGFQNGMITILQSNLLTSILTFRCCNSSILSLDITKVSTDLFLVNCNDRAIRIYDLKNLIDNFLPSGVKSDINPTVVLQDQVNRISWSTALFTSKNEYIISCSPKHDMLFLWDLMTGVLLKTMTLFSGARFVHLSVHPYRSIVVSVASGVVAVWSRPVCQKYSSIEPTSTHVDANTLYEERESEFDDPPSDNETVCVNNSFEKITIEPLPHNFDPITQIDASTIALTAVEKDL